MIKVGINIGHSKISSIVGNVKSNKPLEILSLISRPSYYLKKGIVTNPLAIKDDINLLIKDSAKESQTEISNIILNLSLINSQISASSTTINLENNEVNDLFLRAAINQSNFLEDDDNFYTLLRAITGYELDNNQNLQDPRGIYGEKLKVNFFKLMVKENSINSIRKIFKELDINIEYFVPNSLSSSLATLNEDEKELGSICLDLGAGSTSFAIFDDKKLMFVNAIPVGGSNVTYDLARGISTTIESAERLKTLYGSVITHPSDDHEIIEVPLLGTDKNQFKQISRSEVNSIIKVRIEETLELARQKIKEFNLHKRKARSLVLTGGGALLEGIADLAQTIFDSKTRIASPNDIKGLPKGCLKPQNSEIIGLMKFNKEDYKYDFLIENTKKIGKKSVIKQFSSWLDQYI